VSYAASVASSAGKRWSAISEIGEPLMLCRIMRERDPQKWRPVLRMIALSLDELAHDLVGEPLTRRRIMR
jgi:hypothetical protein